VFQAEESHTLQIIIFIRMQDDDFL